MITIAHRLSTAQRADRVAVLEGGRLVEVASHDELVRRGARYARLWAPPATRDCFLQQVPGTKVPGTTDDEASSPRAV